MSLCIHIFSADPLQNYFFWRDATDFAKETFAEQKNALLRIDKQH